MSKVDPGAHGGGEQRPKLTPEVLGGNDVAVLTIKEARTGMPTSDGRNAALLVFEEVPPNDEGQDYVLWLNKTDLVILCDRLGGDDDDWPGQKVPIMKVRAQNPRDKKYVQKYHIAPDEDWDDLMGSRRGGRTAKAARGRKKAARR